MEGKRAVAVCCLLIVVLLSWQPQQVAAMSKFCRCYQHCYTECRKDTTPYPCNVDCFQNCINGDPNPPAIPSATDCNAVCGIHICGEAIPPTDVQACMDGCTKNLGAHDQPMVIPES